MSGFTHFNEDGNAVMVDVGEKAETKREALASGVIRMSEECFQKVKEGSMKKGDVLGVARIAGIMGAKKTAELIPLCHLLNLTKVEICARRLTGEWRSEKSICLKSPVEKAGNGYVKRILISGKKSKYLQRLTVEKTRLMVYNRL